MAMGQVKDSEGKALAIGDMVRVVEDILYPEADPTIRNKISEGTLYKVKGFPADDRYIQVRHGESDWAIMANKVRKT